MGETVNQFIGGWVACTPDSGGFKDWIYWPTTQGSSAASKFTINANTDDRAQNFWSKVGNDPTAPLSDAQKVPVKYASRGDGGTNLYGLFTNKTDTPCQMKESDAKWWAMGATAFVNPAFASAWAFKLRGFNNVAYPDAQNWPKTQIFFFPIRRQVENDDFVRYGDVFVIVPVKVNNAWKKFVLGCADGPCVNGDLVPNLSASMVNQPGFSDPYYNPPESIFTKLVPDPSAAIATQFYHFCNPPEGIAKCLGETNGSFQWASVRHYLDPKTNRWMGNQLISTCASQCGEGVQYIPIYAGYYSFINQSGTGIDCTDQNDQPVDNPCANKPCTCCRPGTTVCQGDGSVNVKCKWINEANPEELPMFDWECPCVCTDNNGEKCVKNTETGKCECLPKKTSISLGLKIMIGIGIALFIIVLFALIFGAIRNRNDNARTTGG